jgi:salicylate hydroxylase
MGESALILIVGGGIGGLSAALALIRKGYDVRVYEQAAELKEIGAGIQLGPNGTRCLIALGLRDELERWVCPAAGKEVRLFNTGQTWKLFDLGQECIQRYGAPYWLAHRGDLHRALAEAVEAARPRTIVTAARCVGLEQDADGVDLHLADSTRVRGEILIGADGVHSVIRQHLFGDMKAEFVGRAAWRGLVPMEKLPDRLRRPVGTNWVGPGRNVITYPVHAGQYLNFVGQSIHPEWQVESWTERGSKEECAADFEGWHEDVRRIVSNIEVPYKWAVRGREPLSQWTIGRVTLLGDAAHPTLPALAQGANMAIEDGIVVARCIDAADDPRTALLDYEAARRPRTTAIVLGSAENAARFNSQVLANDEEAAAYIEREWQPDLIAKRYDWIFEYDALTAPLEVRAARVA